MFNLSTETKALDFHRRKLLREAKLQHLIREMQRGQVKLHQRFIALLADVLISGGSRLKAHYNSSRRPHASPPFYEVKPQNY